MSAEWGPRPALQIGAVGFRSSGWWGLVFLLMSEAAGFAYVLFAYYYYLVQPDADWVPGGPPHFKYSGPQSVIVVVGCLTAWVADRALAREAVWLSLLGLAATVLLGSGFIALQLIDWWDKPFHFATSTYSSAYFLVSGFHLAHFLLGWLMFVVLFAWTAFGYFDRVRRAPVTIGAFYWYFLTLSWFAVFFALFITPYLYKPG